VISNCHFDQQITLLEVVVTSFAIVDFELSCLLLALDPIQTTESTFDSPMMYEVNLEYCLGSCQLQQDSSFVEEASSAIEVEEVDLTVAMFNNFHQDT
jgi:hypothetical protein